MMLVDDSCAGVHEASILFLPIYVFFESFQPVSKVGIFWGWAVLAVDYLAVLLLLVLGSGLVNSIVLIILILRIMSEI